MKKLLVSGGGHHWQLGYSRAKMGWFWGNSAEHESGLVANLGGSWGSQQRCPVVCFRPPFDLSCQFTPNDWYFGTLQQPLTVYFEAFSWVMSGFIYLIIYLYICIYTYIFVLEHAPRPKSRSWTPIVGNFNLERCHKNHLPHSTRISPFLVVSITTYL